MTSIILLRSNTVSGAAYVERGRGQPLLLLHGVGMRAEAWQPQIETLADKARVIALDLPGHGGTPALPGAPTLRDFVTWLVRVVDELELTRFSLAGHSMGGLIATGFAGQRPCRRVRTRRCHPARTV